MKSGKVVKLLSSYNYFFNYYKSSYNYFFNHFQKSSYNYISTTMKVVITSSY